MCTSSSSNSRWCYCSSCWSSSHLSTWFLSELSVGIESSWVLMNRATARNSLQFSSISFALPFINLKNRFGGSRPSDACSFPLETWSFIFSKGRGQKKKFFLGQSPEQRTPPTDPVGLGLFRKLTNVHQNHEKMDEYAIKHFLFH